MLLCPTASIEVSTHKALRTAWKLYGDTPTRVSLVGRYILHGQLTATQRKRLPRELADRLEERAA